MANFPLILWDSMSLELECEKYLLKKIDIKKKTTSLDEKSLFFHSSSTINLLSNVFSWRRQSDVLHRTASYLQALDGESQHTWRQLGRLLEGEVAPVDDEDEAVDLQLRVLDHGLQWQQDGSQNIDKGVSAEVEACQCNPAHIFSRVLSEEKKQFGPLFSLKIWIFWL